MWSDSKVALHWIRGHASRWKTFVANCVAHIQTQLPDAQWRHVAGRDNPADCASRGINPQELIDHKLWWKEPDWLIKEESSNKIEISEIDLPEKKATSMSVKSKIIVEPELLLKYSSLHQLLRISA